MKSTPPRIAATCAALLTAIALLGAAGCDQRPSLEGTWHKASGGSCAIAYPGKLVFFDDGTYAGGQPLWHGGEYGVTDGGRVQLDTTTCPGVYLFKLSGNTLTFRNDWNCEFKYVKEEAD